MQSGIRMCQDVSGCVRMWMYLLGRTALPGSIELRPFEMPCAPLRVWHQVCRPAIDVFVVFWLDESRTSPVQLPHMLHPHPMSPSDSRSYVAEWKASVGQSHYLDVSPQPSFLLMVKPVADGVG